MIGAPEGINTESLTYSAAFSVTAALGGSLTFKTTMLTAKLQSDLKKNIWKKKKSARPSLSGRTRKSP